MKNRTFPKLNGHPDCDEVKKLIADGESPIEIAKLLRERYPGNKKLWMDHPYLYAYRNQEHPILSEKKRRTKYDYRERKEAGLETTVNAPEIDVATRIMILTGQTPKPPVPMKILSNEQLIRWTEGVDGFNRFVEEMIVERGEHVTLQDYQIEMAKNFLEFSRVCVNGAGQIGKDFMMQNFITWWAITHAGSQQMVLCATQSQSVALMTRVMDKIGFSADLQAAFMGKGMKPDPMITFKNGSIAYFLTAKSAIAGKTNIDIIYINEARDVKEEEVTRVSPLLGVGGGKLFVLSRPRFRRGYFWNCYSGGGFKTMKIETERNKYFDREVLEDDRATLSTDLFRIEYLAEFADAGSSYFSETSIDYCSSVDYEFQSMVPEPKYKFSLGIDPARLRDTSAMIVVGQHEDPNHSPRYKVFHVHGFSPDRAAKASFINQFAYVQLLNNAYKFTHVIPEYSGMGIPFSENLTENWRENIGSPSLIKPYPNMSLRDKIAVYDFTKRVIETHDISMPRGAARLINELKMTQFGATDMGKVKIETPITDDYSDALCFALWAFKAPFEPGIAIIKRPIQRPDVLRRKNI